jgi:hypothetical protein
MLLMICWKVPRKCLCIYKVLTYPLLPLPSITITDYPLGRHLYAQSDERTDDSMNPSFRLKGYLCGVRIVSQSSEAPFAECGRKVIDVVLLRV